MNDLSQLEGLYVAQLTEEELKLFNAAVASGDASRIYNFPCAPAKVSVNVQGTRTGRISSRDPNHS